MDTGLNTHTGGRVKKICERLGHGIFMMTYGDGLCDIDIRKLLGFHLSHGKLATVTAVRPPARFGALTFKGDNVTSFQEKPTMGEGWINGGFFVLDTRVADYIDSDETPFETSPLTRLAENGELVGFKHPGFWHCMDTLRDMRALDQMWSNNNAPWKIWDSTGITKMDNDKTTIVESEKSLPHRPHGI
jgi:glucose-1-phosphate cytidylyltransferase